MPRKIKFNDSLHVDNTTKAQDKFNPESFTTAFEKL